MRAIARTSLKEVKRNYSEIIADEIRARGEK